MAKRIGRYTVALERPVHIAGYAAVGSKMEREGPLGDKFDILCDDSYFGQKTWEKAESIMQKQACQRALDKAKYKETDIDYIFAGDLLNQCISSSFSIRDLEIPFFGLYGACSTMSESLSLASLMIEGGIADRCIASTSSHFCTAERQFRFPLEYGGQRPPSAQWTATAAGSVVLDNDPKSAKTSVKAVTAGRIMDLGVTDQNNMGAAMAPAAADTISRFFNDTAVKIQDIDMIFTGDLGQIGSELLYELLDEEGMDIRGKHTDCGLLLYDRNKQDVHAGGSGCGCSASVLCTHILPLLEQGTLHNVLFMATGALLSTTSVQQNESIPGIAHLVHLCKETKGEE